MVKKIEIHEKIRTLRELAQWSQEDIAERLNMSLSGYAKIERGETKPNIVRLQQIAEVFGTDLSFLVDTSHKGFIFLFNENCSNNSNNHYEGEEMEKLTLIITHKDEIIAMQAEQIAQQEEMISLLKQQISAIKS